ncbi:hypothetical protein N800_11390 [Lysobacter daejeonensis GH1-9]|uniref:Lipid A 3-O-deacylase n=1 Tax=Lysobacter daejeonensis GH1-9 TaxID=1385517 RepID=A0A0A0EQ69_9GAMM|nr:acyloxyacyl hydrolase [Lysobacter daejeonensis]KGM52614.1 hypothetical protein N800_11390 [Lysobacter daejeonensis GH1-9]
MRAWATAWWLLLGLCVTPPAWAQVHLGGGWADSIEGEGAEMASLAWVSAQRHPWEVMAGYIGEREGAHVPDAVFFAVSKRLVWRRWFASGGVAWVSEDNHVLSGHGQFLTGAGYTFGRTSLSLRHLSNADTGGRNRGETFVLLEVGF